MANPSVNKKKVVCGFHKREPCKGGRIKKFNTSHNEIKQKGAHIVKNKYWSSFVRTLFSQADKRYTRQYELKRLGYDLNKTLKELAWPFIMRPSAIGPSVRRGETIKEENNYQLMG